MSFHDIPTPQQAIQGTPNHWECPHPAPVTTLGSRWTTAEAGFTGYMLHFVTKLASFLVMTAISFAIMCACTRPELVRCSRSEWINGWLLDGRHTSCMTRHFHDCTRVFMCQNSTWKRSVLHTKPFCVQWNHRQQLDVAALLRPPLPPHWRHVLNICARWSDLISLINEIGREKMRIYIAKCTCICHINAVALIKSST